MNNNKIKVVFLGTPDFSIPCLKSLLQNDEFEVQAIITQPDRITGRKKLLTPPPVKASLGNPSPIKIYQPEKLNRDLNLIKKLKRLNPDFFVVVAFGQILSQKVLDIPKYGSINIHASLLPKYRGASPIHQALINGDEKTGVTIMQMAKTMDSGDIWTQEHLVIQADDDIESLNHKLSQVGAKSLIDTLLAIRGNTIEAKRQDESQASYCQKISIEDGQIDWNKDSSKEIINKIKAFKIWPSCYCHFEGKKLKIIKAKSSNFNSQLRPGHSFLDHNRTLHIATSQGSLIPQELQIEGKNTSLIKDFQRGYPDINNYQLS